jgi:hypothetical protein
MLAHAQNTTSSSIDRTGVTYDATSNLLGKVSGSWSNTVPGSAGGTSGGPIPAFNPTTNTIIFSYATYTVGQTIAINNALQGSGVQVGGYDYSWKINNNDMNTGTISALVSLKGTAGNVLHSYAYDYSNIRTIGDAENFQLFSGTQWFPKDYSLTDLSTISLEFTGKDNRYWAGYWGPRVRDPSLALRYISAPIVIDPCLTDPLSSPTCPGYTEAYKTQQCTINALFDPTCPGYATAYLNQQCTVSALYDSSCPGYAIAYHDQQCTANPLYMSDCPGYATAYFNQQCTINPLYDKSCSGYEQAYLNQQCLKDSLYSTKCEGYKTAYAIKYLTNLDPAVTTAVNQQLTTNVEVYKADPANQTTTTSTTTTTAADPVTTSTTTTPTVTSITATPSTTSATSVTSVTSVVAPPPPPPASPMSVTAPPPPKQEAKKEEAPAGGQQVAKEAPSNRAPATRREQIAQQRIEANAKADAQAGAEVAKSVDASRSMQEQVAKQGAVVAAMAFVPGFDAYGRSNIPDVQFYKPYSVYGNQRNIDNRSAARMFGGSELKHQQMINDQYKGN